MTDRTLDMAMKTDEAYWILDFCAACDQMVWMDVMEQMCPECLGR